MNTQEVLPTDLQPGMIVRLSGVAVMLSYEVDDDDDGWDDIGWKVLTCMDTFNPDRDSHSRWWLFDKADPVDVITKNR